MDQYWTAKFSHRLFCSWQYSQADNIPISFCRTCWFLLRILFSIRSSHCHPSKAHAHPKNETPCTYKFRRSFFLASFLWSACNSGMTWRTDLEAKHKKEERKYHFMKATSASERDHDILFRDGNFSALDANYCVQNAFYHSVVCSCLCSEFRWGFLCVIGRLHLCICNIYTCAQ